MKKHQISFDRTNNINKLKKAMTFNEEYQQKDSELNQQLAKKAHKCFEKLYRILSLKHLTLYQVFTAFDTHSKDNLQIGDFKKIINRLDSSFSN